jgi:hypothetical protein
MPRMEARLRTQSPDVQALSGQLEGVKLDAHLAFGGYFHKFRDGRQGSVRPLSLATRTCSTYVQCACGIFLITICCRFLVERKREAARLPTSTLSLRYVAPIQKTSRGNRDRATTNDYCF